MTNSDILKRYDMTVDNKFIVHANIPSYAALFENYDDTSSLDLSTILTIWWP